MALVTVTFQTDKYVSMVPCDTVGVCLTDAWLGQTLSGFPIAFATVENTGRPLGPVGDRVPPPWENPRRQQFYQYALTFDDAQFAIDPDTDLPFVITCADVLSILEDGCAWQTIIAYLVANP